MRGLKHSFYPVNRVKIKVAPNVGAWIETDRNSMWELSQRVAPHVGAWIETRINLSQAQAKESRTPRGCVD